MRVITVSTNEAGQRLDKLLAKYLDQAPKSFLYKMLRKKNITLNGKKADGSEKTVCGDEVRLFLSEETIEGFQTARTEKQAGSPQMLNGIVYEDAHLLIVNKPAGELSQKARKEDVSMNERIVAYLTAQQRREDSFTPGICNRLDRNTSGLLVAGKTLAGLQTMAELLRTRSLRKYYLCIVQGEVRKPQRVSGYLKKDETCNRVTICKDRREGEERIETAYTPLCRQDGKTLLAVHLITGKTHQIRAHLADCGFPILGDSKYADTEKIREARERYHVEHQLLHAYLLVFPELSGTLSQISGKTIAAEPPRQFVRVADQIFGREVWNDAVMEFKGSAWLRSGGAHQPDE